MLLDPTWETGSKMVNQRYRHEEIVGCVSISEISLARVCISTLFKELMSELLYLKVNLEKQICDVIQCPFP
jgi:hypothetical protein